MSWKNQLRNDSVPWLLERENPDVHYLTLRDLFDLPSDDRELKSTRKVAHKEGTIAEILSHMDKEGYWVNRDLDTIQNTVQRSGPSFCLPNSARLGMKTSESSKPVNICSTMR